MAKGSFSAELFIDWNLFRKQRKTLESLSNFHGLTTAQRDDIQGILRLLDTVQEAGFTSGYFTENQVYGHH